MAHAHPTQESESPHDDVPRLLLADHHHGIEAAFKALLAATYMDDPRDLVLTYRGFEREVLEHIAAEEEQLLPAYASAEPERAAQIRDEHVQLRQQLAAIAVDVELHAVRAETLVRLIQALREHARREDAHLYPWAEAHLSPAARRELFVRIGTSLRRLARLADRYAVDDDGRRTEYGFERVLVGASVDQAIERVTTALADEGFGVLTRIDLGGTLKKKLDVDFRPYVILGACNPQLAHRAVSADPRIGLLLPCNVVVEEVEGGARVSIADPTAMFRIAGAAELEAVAREAEARLRRVLGALA